MGNQIRYRNYTHAEGEVDFEISQEAEINPENGIAETVVQRWTLMGELLVTDGSDNQAELTTRIQALERAYGVQGGDLVFLLDDGSNSAHLIRSNATIGGTHVKYLDWLSTPGAYANHRKYRIGLEARFPLPTRSGITYWRETVEFFGGGPKIRHQESVKGFPRPQQIKAHTVYRARQFGDIVGLYDYAPYPTPIWPSKPPYLPDLTRKASGSPKPAGIQGIQFKDYPRSYAYEFESPTSLFGLPNFWNV